MDAVKGVFLVLVILLSTVSFFLFIQTSTQRSDLSTAVATNQLTLQLLKAQGIPCTSVSTNFNAVGDCVVLALKQKDFKEDSFAQPDEKKGTSGYLLIKNVNHVSYAASNFTFLYNKEVAQEGCTIEGTIDYSNVCRFTFEQRCEKGDILEANYTAGNRSVKIFARNC
jgi:hypothetical protein